MTDHAELRRLAEQASSGNWYGEDSQVLIGKHAVAYCNHKVDAQFIGKATPKTVLALLDDIDRLKAENEELRQIVSGCATACGAGCSPECTLDFMSMLPDEIASVVGRRARNAAIGSVVWQFIDRMTDVCEQDPADRILEQFVAAVRPAIDAAIEGAKQ
ncbi:ead/Ea22-like family protein [Pseudomonas aeruginosa]